jgi:poly [ADP-ribose] polymerase
LFSTPLGIVTQDAIDEARSILVQIGDLVQAAHWSDSLFNRYNNQFFQLVPQDLGRGRQTCQDLWPDMKKVQERNNLLDNLEGSLKVALTPATTDKDESKTETKKMFAASMDLIKDTAEFDRLNKKFLETLNRTHVASGLKLKRAFTVKIDSMHDDFVNRGLPLGNVMELWHGTGTGNIISILKTGFKVAPPSTARIAGKMFGNGLYHAIQSTKSLNYAYGYWSGERNKTCYMFLNDVALGNYKVPSHSTSSPPPQGYHTWWAKPGISGIQNDEIVAFGEYQVNPRYLLEFSEY